MQDKHDPSQQPENVVLMGWCVPASCRIDDLQTYLNKYLADLKFPLKRENVTYTAAFDENSCQTKEDIKQYDHVDISFGYVIVFKLTTSHVAWEPNFAGQIEVNIVSSLLLFYRKSVVPFVTHRNSIILSVKLFDLSAKTATAENT